jgi:hypothetical protein
MTLQWMEAAKSSMQSSSVNEKFSRGLGVEEVVARNADRAESPVSTALSQTRMVTCLVERSRSKS